ncbi:MAG TPA: four-carbon acid sugar kinase family protein, partial [Herpetosiphonaceae bacterium]|nr:four-carbon acid sugar kinase family protein [Herpetosiphonaceae bacterium]
HVYTSDTFDPAELGRPHPDVCIVDTNSRLDPARVAYEKVYAATRQLQEAGCEHFFNKTCSVFRGNIGPELDAMLDALGETLAVVVLGFPKNGRVTRDGIHYVHGLRLEDSHFRHDPIHPATGSNLAELLQSQTERTCGLVTHDVVSAGIAPLQDRLAELRARCQYIIFDVLDQVALATIARATGDCRVFAGSSALAEELPVVWGGGRDHADPGILPPQDGKGALCVAGSLTPQTKAQIEFLQAQGLAMVELDTLRIFDPAGRTEEIERIVAPLVDHLTVGRHAVVHAANQPSLVERTQTEGERRGLHRAEVGRLVGETLAEIVVRASRYTGLRRIVIAGGETSEAICRRLGIHGMRVWKEIQPGVPSCVSLQDRPLLLVLKSGSFGTPDFLEQALAHVQAQ